MARTANGTFGVSADEIQLARSFETLANKLEDTSSSSYVIPFAAEITSLGHKLRIHNTIRFTIKCDINKV